MKGRVHLALIVAALVCGTGVARAQLLSPGPLAKAHASIDGDDDCGECHSSGKRLEEGKCLRCHGDLGARIKAGAGLHGRNYKGKKCSECHVEHIGRDGKLVRWPRGDKSRLSHGQTGWPLVDKHRSVNCDTCHTNKNVRGNKTYLGLSTSCVSCHKDPHSGRFGKCESCHTVKGWKQVAIAEFDHSLAKFPLEGKHASVECKKCHGTPPKYRGIAFGACTDCHQDPHRGKFKQSCASCHTAAGWDQADSFRGRHPGLKLIGGHRRVKCEKCHDRGNTKSPSKGRACAACHAPIHLAKFGKDCKSCHAKIIWAGLPEAVGRKNHDATRYPLEGKHRKTACDDCHPKARPLAQRYRGLAFERCTPCHADRHDGEFAGRDAGECGPCHTVRGFRPTIFGVEHHASTAYRLEGKHVAAPCSSCHAGERPRVKLTVAAKVCADCHENPHGEQFATEIQRGGCETCHTELGWRQAKIDHSTWPLTGAHATTPCTGCHDTPAGGAAAGKGATYRGVTRECDGCHDDRHAGQFRIEQPTRTCDVCHSTARFAIPEFDHGSLTRYPLEGKHAELTCAKCHPKTRLRGGGDAVRYRLGYETCRDCHANPHRGSGEASLVGEMACSGCHDSTAWKLTTSAGGGGFDHARTGFPLTGAHRETGCADCHESGKRLGRDCAGCHADEHKGRMSTQCDACHNGSSWLETRASRQHRLTRLPLTGMHAVLDCSSCHIRMTERQWTGVPADCFACHEKDYRGDAHPVHEGDAADPSARPFSRACGECHRTTAWSPAIVDPDVFQREARPAIPDNHDARFPISFGKHQGADCGACHVTSRAPEIVECTGCHTHDAAQLRLQHGEWLAGRDGAACLRCHPGGMAR